MILDILTAIVGTLMSLAYFPQAYKIWKKKTAKEISLISYSIFSAGTLLWVIYGFYVGNLVIIISFIPGVIGSWLVLILSIIYRKK